MRQIEKNKKIITCSEGSNIFQRKGFNLDILLIEQVILVYNAVNEFAASDKKIIKYTFPDLTDFAASGQRSTIFLCLMHQTHQRLAYNKTCKNMEWTGVIKPRVIKPWSKGWSRARGISLKSNHWQNHSTALRNWSGASLKKKNLSWTIKLKLRETISVQGHRCKNYDHINRLLFRIIFTVFFLFYFIFQLLPVNV